jgi:hypothetical protein
MTEKNTIVTCVAVWTVADSVLERVLVDNGLTVKKRVTVPDVL